MTPTQRSCPMPRALRFRPILLAVVMILAAGCASTEKRFERAGEFEAEARWVEAAGAYAEVLEREPEYPGARERLAETGDRAVRQLFDNARTLDAAGDPAAGVSELDRLTALVERAGRVGVALAYPSGFDRMRVRLVEAAIAALESRAAAAAARGDWAAAVGAYDEALGRYEMTGDVRRRLVFARAAALVSWARADMNRGRFRAAYERAGTAVASLDSTNSEAEQEARGVYAAALAQGVRKLAVLPFWQTEAWRAAAPPRLLDDVNQSLADDRRATPSPFVVLVDPADGRRYVRLNRLDAILLDRVRMTDAGRQLGAHFVATGEASRFTRSERSRREESVRARVRGRTADTTYTRRELDVRFEGRIEYRVVDVASGRIRAERSVEAEVTERLTRSTFGGDWSALDLTDRERREFDPSEWARQDDELGLRLADRLSAALAERIYADVLDLIE